MLKQLLSILLAFCIPAFAFAQSRQYTLPKNVSKSDYSSEFIVIKTKSNYTKTTINAKRNNSEKYQLEHFLPYLNNNQDNNARTTSHPLSNIYKLKINIDEKPIEVINQLLQNKNIIYAEPYFFHQSLYIPDDPEAQTSGNQWYLNTIKAYDAWTIEKGDTSIVVGILDTGILPEHFDITDNLFINTNDPVNGLDDDNDGLIDNYKGWDIANNDNNPLADTDLHGLSVAGISSAATNNGKGLAGIGFNSKFMPIKIFKSGSNNISNGYEAIALAADLGCQIINLSWGSAGTFSQAGQDIIDYAVLEKDAVVIASAGNTNEQLDFYPASFDNVLSVGASDIDDQKAFFGTYSYHIDLLAPGQDIYVLNGDSTYIKNQGSSFSAPMVSGTAALIRSRYPSLSAIEVMERIRVNSDDIYANNSNYIGQLGKGRLNVFKALTNNTSPSLRVNTYEYNNGIGQYAFVNDTLSLSIEVINHLNNVTNAKAVISCTSPFVIMIDSVFDIGSLNQKQVKNNQSDPFIVKLSNDLPPNHQLDFRIDFTDGSYSDFQYLQVISSPDYLTLDNGTISFTVGSAGELGYNKDNYNQGIGYKYKGHKLLDNVGLIITNSSDTVKNTVTNNLNFNDRSHDFEVVERIKMFQNSIAEIDVRTTFRDSLLVDTVLNIHVAQKILGWNDDASSDFMIMEYRLTNVSEQPIAMLHTCLFTDWNLNNKNQNAALWDNTNKIGYVKDLDTDTLFTGIVLLKNAPPIYHALNNKNLNGNSADINNLLNDNILYDLVSNGISKTSAGLNGVGNDVSNVIGYTLENLAINASEKLAFAFVSGNSLIDLQSAAQAAKAKYNSYNNTPPLLHISEVCKGEVANINPPQGDIYNFYNDVNLTNLLTTAEFLTTAPVNETQTYYVVNKDISFDGDVYRVVAQPKLVNADFEMSENPLLLDETGNTSLLLTDKSIDAIEWDWDFRNGFASTVQNPSINFPNTGMYNIELNVTNDIGCSETITKTLEVANRSNKPNIADQQICKGQIVNLEADNVNDLRIYTDSSLSTLIHTGTSFESLPLYNDTLFYVTSLDSLYESNATAINISVSKVKALFDYTIDTTDLTTKKLIHLTNESDYEELSIWYINDEIIGNSIDVDYDYSENGTFEIKLLAEDINGCQDIYTQTITPKISPSPIVETATICKDENVVISPSNGNVFLFYSDSDLNQLIGKGNQFAINNVESDTSLFITSIDSLLESSPVKVDINLSKIKADFTILPDSVISQDADIISISNQSIDSEFFQWFINDSLFSHMETPGLQGLEVGSYTLQLIVSNQIGCVDTTTHQLLISPVTGLETTNNILSIYPNPTNGILQIKSPVELKVALININGQTIRKAQGVNPIIDISAFPNGIYTLQIATSNKKIYKKIIKKSN